MAKIPDISTDVVDLLYSGLKKTLTSPFRLTRLGASGIGEECLRSIWYGWRGYTQEEHEGRLLRLFKTGHLQEDRIVADLKNAGLEVWEIDPETGEQWTHTTGNGHFVCKLDGVLRGIPGCEKTPHNLEIKTHNKNSFAEVSKHGVQRAKPAHYDQMHCGMMLSGLKRSLYVALCKDNEAYYVERVVFDEAHANKLEQKIELVLKATMPPSRIAEKDDAYACKWCDHKAVCKQGAEPNKTCRSCAYAEPVANGEWVCSATGEVLSPADQLAACGDYEVIRG